MRSARRCIGAFEPCASSTRRTICASAVSRPTCVARKTNEPVLFSVAPMTWSPGPVHRQALAGQHALVERRAALVDHAVDRHLLARADAHQVADAARLRPACRARAPSRTTRAVRACRPISALIAAPVCFFARASSQRPSRISAMMMTPVSKYRSLREAPLHGQPRPQRHERAVAVGDAGADRDQRVHVGAAVAAAAQAAR